MLTNEDHERIEKIRHTLDDGNAIAKAKSYEDDVVWLLRKLSALDNKLLERELDRDPSGENAKKAISEVLQALSSNGYWSAFAPMGGVEILVD